MRCALLAAAVLVTSLIRVTDAGAAAEIGAERIVVRGEGASVTVERVPFRMSVQDGAGRTVLEGVDAAGAGPLAEPPTTDPEQNGGDAAEETTLYAPLSFTVGSERIEQFPAGTWVGNLQTAVRSGTQFSVTAVVEASAEGEGARLVLATNDPSGRRLVLDLQPFRRGAIRVAARASPDDGVSVMAASFASPPDEAFHGFGGRHNAIDQRGVQLESFLNQSNVSPGGLEPAVGPLPGTGGDRYMFPNGPTGAYFVQSSFVSSRPYGLLALNDELTRWRMASDRPDAWQVAASARSLDLVVAPGEAPTAIRTLTAITGRQRVPPAWALEPQLDRLVRFPPQSPAEYRAEVLRDLEDIERYGLPVGAYRIEAWEFFARDELRAVIARFRARGIRVLLYFRSFVGRDEIGTDDPRFFDEAVQRGYVATDAAGRPFTFTSNFFAPAAQIDFTDPEAVRWWQGRITEALELGADGFMQDFGEQVFLDMRFDDGSTGATMHNRLPVLFHRATRQALDEFARRHPERGDAFFFTRAGFSGTPGSVAYESATWPGDETSDWSRASGLASQAPDMLNRGIAGAVGFGSDIGGYFDAGRSPTSKELFLRWAAWSALTPVFRLHGTVGAGTHTPWSYDDETVRLYRELSELHRAAAPLIRRLWAEAAETGMPIARPLWLAAPEDPRLAGEEQSWLLGPDVLVAPVVEEGADGREVRFPPGCWERPAGGGRFAGGRATRVAAPLGTLPYFFRCGTRPFEPPPSSGPAASSGRGRPCAADRVLRAVRVRPLGQRGAAVRFGQRPRRPVTIDVFQVSAGRQVLGERRVARFARRTRGVRFGTGGRSAPDGLFFIRLRTRGASGRPDVRRIVLQRRQGRFARRPSHHRRAPCGLVSLFKLERPAFGGRGNLALGIAFRLAGAADVRVDVLRGRRVVRRLRGGTPPAGRVVRLRLPSERLRRGDHRIRLTATPRGGRAVSVTLTARRL